MRVCVGCGNHNDDDNLFCTGCGQRLWPASIKRATPKPTGEAKETKESKSSSSGSAANGIVTIGTGLPTLDAFTKQMNALFFVEPKDCAARLHEIRMQLFNQRDDERKRSKEGKLEYLYAAPLYESTDDVREEFFSSLAMLIERQAASAPRKRVISLLLELTAIEQASSTSARRTGGGGSAASASESSAFGKAFGWHALRSLKDLMPAVIGLPQLFANCIEDSLAEVINNMSQQHFFNIMPLLLDILRDQDDFGEELYAPLVTISPKLESMWMNLVSEMKDGVNYSPADLAMLRQVSELISICLKAKSTAASYPVMIETLLVRQYALFDKLDGQSYHGGERKVGEVIPFSFFALMARVARASSLEADRFCNGGVMPPATIDEARFKAILAKFKALPETEADIDRSTNPLTFANLVVFMSGLLQSCDRAPQILARTEGRNASLFSLKLFKLAQSFVRLCPELVASCMDMLLFITRNTNSRPIWCVFAEQMERKVEIAKYLQMTMAKIIRESRPVKAHKDALICAIEMMTYYNSFNPNVSKMLNMEHETGYDREAIIFKILKRKNDDFFDDDLKLAAARCLSAVSLAEFDKKEIRKLVKIFSVLPALVSQKTYAMMTQLMFLMFKMAIQPSGEANDRSCGHTFRTIYATEVVSTVFGIIDKIIVGDETPIKAEKHKDRFVLACVKFLQTAWGHPEFLPRPEDVTPLTVLLKCLRAEQVTLTSLKTRYYRLVSENRCVDCDDELSKLKTARRTDRPRVRCEKCEKIQAIHGVHQRWGYSHLFMEQSSVGFNIPNMFKCLRALREVDVATFRCFHQIANILEDTTHRDVLDNLIDAANTGTTEESYTQWSDAASGDGIKYCEDVDKEEWDDRDAMLRNIQEATFLYSAPTAKDIGQLKTIEDAYRQEVYNWENKGLPPPELVGDMAAKDVETLIKERGDDQRTVFLCLRVNRRPNVKGVRQAPKRKDVGEGDGKVALKSDDGKGESGDGWEDEDGSQILAFVAGGVARAPPEKVSYASEGHNAELYTIFARPQHPNIEALMRRLLAEFSHKLCQLGYDRCYSWVHTQERVLFSRATWDTDRRKTVGEPAVIEFKNFCYMWELKNNAWISNPAHEEYCRMNGMETLVNFLVHTTDGEQKHEYIRSYESVIRTKMEEFGGRLAKTFHDEQEKKKKREEDHKGEEKQPSDNRDAPVASPLLPIVERSMMAPRIRLDQTSQPAWMSVQTGSKEEVFLMSLTSSPALDANYDPEPDPDPIDDPNPDEGESSDDEDEHAKIRAKEAKDKAAAAATTTPAGGASSTTAAAANGHAHTNGTVTHGGNKQEDDPDFLRGSIKAVVAALFRGMHILLTRSTRDNRDRSLAVLQYGHLFDKIKVLCGTFDYGIRTAVQDPMHDQFGICLKYVRIMENMLITLPVGTKESLFYLEVYEQMAHVTVDVTQRLVRLFNSRNTNVRDPLHMLRRFHPTEERLLASIARLAYRLVSHVASITMFRGTLEWIARGNRECRKEAVRLLFTQNEVMVESLHTLILYDFETGTDFSLEEKANEEKVPSAAVTASAAGVGNSGAATATARNRRFRPYRDEMRRNLVDVLAEFCRADATFKYKFIERYNSVMIKADLSLRQSFLDSILGRIDMLNFKDKLSEFLLARGVIGSNGPDADEYIIDLSFVDHSIYRRTNTLSPKLFILTNHAYYLSVDSFDDDITSVIHELSPSSLPMFLNLQRREYADVTKIVRDRADQMWSIERFTQSPNVRLRNTTLPKITEIFLARRLGVTGNLLWYMQRMCRNDMNQTIPVREDAFTEEVIRGALFDHPKVNITRTFASVNLVTHVTIKKGPGNYAKRLLILVAQSLEMHLICARYDRKSWHSVLSQRDRDNKEGMIERGNKFFCLNSSEPVHTKLSSLDVVEFTENNEPHMILGFTKQKLHVVFHCDAARELWRREIKNHLMKDANWTTSIMPALKAASRSVSKLF